MSVCQVHIVFLLLAGEAQRYINLLFKSCKTERIVPQHSSHCFVAASKLTADHRRLAKLIDQLSAAHIFQNLDAEAIFQGRTQQYVRFRPERESLLKRRVALFED